MSAPVPKNVPALRPDRLAELKAQGVAMIGLFHHPEDVADLPGMECNLSVNAIQGECQHVAQ